jgi:hypothetical protein
MLKVHKFNSYSNTYIKRIAETTISTTNRSTATAAEVTASTQINSN